MLDHCPGAANIRTPTLAIKKCPQCGEEVEVFSSDVSVKCSRCGFEVYNDIMSCVQWCKHAKECVGTETYDRIIAQLKARDERKAVGERKSG
jgi:NADH pyrophosphatase NudC (nudix superfamily)